MKKRSVVGKLMHPILSVLPIFLVFISLALADVPINILPSNHWAAAPAQEEKIYKIINENFDLDDTILYKVNVKILYNNLGSVDHLNVYLLSKNSYSYNTVRINLRARAKISSHFRCPDLGQVCSI
jgi:hypothetical protein